ncbi:NERD domain-containing protein [Pallidibacillus pasinlerensis]|uniref:NERD domain-containing protein n=1 Tax=Pallidibacillus pasinlerensis TaxID=2703818 RepID=A0ABX0A5G4_9BACI|nr:NERD domain-containing protein [Pallidibacillus pasinlerensis]NCU18691.1 NERD domain-containing protein [Pallidibacillus pasinlerensis]
MIETILTLIVVGIFIRWVNRNLPKWIGNAGEKAVKREIEKLEKANPNTYFSFHDLYIPKKDGTYSQIDHVIVSEYGIFVLETKSYSGWIFGDAKQKYWTQVIYQKKSKFLNPIWQNKGHIKYLNEWLGDGYNNLTTHSIILFSSQANFKTDIKTDEAQIIYIKNLRKTLEQYREPVINKAKVETVVKKLQSLEHFEKEDKNEIAKTHVQNIKSKKFLEKKKIEQNICPKCGGTLQIRKGKYGEFKGCSNFPKCRFTEKLKA